MEKRAITLVELLAALVLITVLAASVVVVLRSPLARVKESFSLAQLQDTFQRHIQRSAAEDSEFSISTEVNTTTLTIVRNDSAAITSSIDLSPFQIVELWQTNRSQRVFIRGDRKGFLEPFGFVLESPRGSKRIFFVWSATGELEEVDNIESLKKLLRPATAEPRLP